MTGPDMHTQTAAVPTDGEAKLRTKRNRFWRYSTIAFVMSIFIGALNGWLLDQVKDGTLPMFALYILLGMMAAAFVWFTRDYFRRIDEFDLLDNLWANTIALYGTMIVFFGWFALHDVGVLRSPDPLWLVMITVGLLLLSYTARKLGWR
ncbi:hypothetical protein HME9302_01098 [Alteripontixanthobacter maritimus]|uniref:Uncharacterized protein n=1 Tax=Alteripontixanthobacter maritimus TaxID=2161824 RepID=A0A369Q4T2_9SPHN|nr:hypothetical protein [Alteripontixanthobacter maritimus]RDC59901.1 hypothetical protein HME9302_01098 [Alteripontixanthobacter maritimus]